MYWSTLTSEVTVAPIIRPTISSELLSLSCLEMAKTIKRMTDAPTEAAPAVVHGPVAMVGSHAAWPMMISETARLEPELMPRTSGPARAFLKSVCMASPARERLAPASTQVNALVILNCQTISDQI